MVRSVWIALAAATIFLLAPIFLNVDLFIDLKEKKGYFSFYLMRLIKIYGGYATLYDRGIAFHLTNGKAVLLPYNEVVDTRKKFEITRGFYILTYRHVAEIGSENNLAAALMTCAALQAAGACVAGLVFRAGKCTSFRTDVLLHANVGCIKLSLSAILVFNLAILFLAAAKIALRKILEKIENHEHKKARAKDQRTGRALARRIERPRRR